MSDRWLEELGRRVGEQAIVIEELSARLAGVRTELLFALDFIDAERRYGTPGNDDTTCAFAGKPELILDAVRSSLGRLVEDLSG